jgi:hypothetical protein
MSKIHKSIGTCEKDRASDWELGGRLPGQVKASPLEFRWAAPKCDIACKGWECDGDHDSRSFATVAIAEIWVLSAI